MPRLDCGNFELEYETSPGPGEPVVLVPGSFGDSRQFAPVFPALGAGYRLIRYDRRGQGRSGAPEKSVSLSDHVGDLGTLISLVGRGSVHLVGSSYGGTVALELAGDRPDLVRSLSVHEPPLLGLIADDAAWSAGVADFRARLEGARRLVERKDPTGAARSLVEGFILGSGAWDRLSTLQQAEFSAGVARGLSELFDPTAQSIDLERLPDLRRPILLTAGSASLGPFAPVGDRLASAGRSVSRFTFEGAAHLPHVTHPAEFTDLHRRFFRWASESTGGS